MAVTYSDQNWDSHKRHREYVAKHHGQWIGLLDNNGTPLMDLPAPVEMRAGSSRNAPANIELTIPVAGAAGATHPIVGELIADNLGKTTASGELAPVMDKTLFLAVERAGAPRRTYWVVMATVKGEDRPQTLTIQGVDCLKLLTRMPAMSSPDSWRNNFARITRDWVGDSQQGSTLSRARWVCGVDMFGSTIQSSQQGAAFDVIGQMLTQCLQAAFRLAGITSNYPIQVAHYPQGRGRMLLLRREDKSLLETIMPAAIAAGINIKASMWLPKDPPVAGLQLTQPTVVISLTES